MTILKEGGLNRTYKMMTEINQNFGIISAYRDEYTEKENKKRQALLIQDVYDMGYSFTHLAGGYWQEEEPEPQLVKSLFITDITKEETLELGKKYRQDMVLYKYKECLRYYVPQDGRVDSEFKTDELILDKIKPYFSRRLKNINQRNVAYVHKNLTLFAFEPNTGMGKHRSYLNAVGFYDYKTDYSEKLNKGEKNDGKIYDRRRS